MWKLFCKQYKIFSPLIYQRLNSSKGVVRVGSLPLFLVKRKSHGLYDRDLTSIFRVFEVNRVERLNMLVEGFQTLGTSDVPTWNTPDPTFDRLMEPISVQSLIFALFVAMPHYSQQLFAKLCQSIFHLPEADFSIFTMLLVGRFSLSRFVNICP